MASIYTDRAGNRRIAVVVAGRRRTIGIGAADRDVAVEVKRRIQRLASAKNLGIEPDAATLDWSDRIAPELHRRLADVGLVGRRGEAATLGAFLAERFSDAGFSRSTARFRAAARGMLLRYFGARADMAAIRSEQARAFSAWAKEKCRPHSYARRMKFAGRVFATARDLGIVRADPFADVEVPSPPGPRRSRERFVGRLDIDRVLAACPNDCWRALVALARYGGLRCPSEIFALDWADVDWEAGRMTVRSSKTARSGADTRVCPLFPEVRRALEKIRRDSGLVVVGIDPNSVRREFAAILTGAGMAPWPKLFQNLRASRATELANDFPPHVAAAWLGHSERIAIKHYWRPTDADYSKASRTSG